MAKSQFEIESGYPDPPGEDELPFDDGEPLETQEHRLQMSLLIEVLDLHWRSRDDVYVNGNMFIHYSELDSGQKKFRGPDVFAVVGGVSKRIRKSWVVWKEGGRLPDFIVELTSESTAEVDRVEKMRLYRYVWRTPEYVIFDPLSGELAVFRSGPGAEPYEPVPADANGRFPCLEPGLSLGLWAGEFQTATHRWLRLFGPDGRVLPTYAEAEHARAEAERARAEAERARAEAERARAEAAEARLVALEAELAALRPGP